MSNPDVTIPQNGKPSGPRDLAVAPVAENDASAPGENEPLKVSAMIEEGDRPSADHGSVERLALAERPGGMAGEG